MIDGEVNRRWEAVIDLAVRGNQGREIVLDVVIDTGFTSYLTLPLSVIESLELSHEGAEMIGLGDGSQVLTQLYAARARINESWSPIIVQQSEGDILAGMALLEDMLLTIEVVQSGRVTVDDL